MKARQNLLNTGSNTWRRGLAAAAPIIRIPIPSRTRTFSDPNQNEIQRQIQLGGIDCLTTRDKRQGSARWFRFLLLSLTSCSSLMVGNLPSLLLLPVSMLEEQKKVQGSKKRSKRKHKTLNANLIIISYHHFLVRSVAGSV